MNKGYQEFITNEDTDESLVDILNINPDMAYDELNEINNEICQLNFIQSLKLSVNIEECNDNVQIQEHEFDEFYDCSNNRAPVKDLVIKLGQ